MILKPIGTLVTGEAAQVSDYWTEEESGGQLYRLRNDATGHEAIVPAELDGDAFETRPFEREEKGALVVWPTRERGEAFAPLREATTLEFLREGYRAKLRKAILECERQGGSDEAIELVRAELVDAVGRADGVLFDLPILRATLRKGCLLDLAPDLTFHCFQGCGMEVRAADYKAHEPVCPARRVYRQIKFFVPEIGGRGNNVFAEVGVRHDSVDHFDAVQATLRDAVARWNVQRIRDALDAAVGPQHPRWALKKCHCESCIFPHAEVIVPVEARLRRLEEKVRLVEPICKKGNVEMLYDACSVRIDKEIAFENRKPPDASAAFVVSSQKVAEEVLKDLSIVLKAFLEPMIIEGHTGATDPPEYWQLLATNRAILIVKFLEMGGVPQGLCKPKGCPGGGAKVLVYPAQDAEK